MIEKKNNGEKVIHVDYIIYIRSKKVVAREKIK